MAICTEWAIVNNESTSIPILKHTSKLNLVMQNLDILDLSSALVFASCHYKLITRLYTSLCTEWAFITNESNGIDSY